MSERSFRTLVGAAILVAILFAISRVGARAATTGTASWYDDGPGLYGAVHSWHWGDTPYLVEVRAPNGNHVTVTVRDYCGCPGGRLIDLSPAAFNTLVGKPHGIDQGLIRGVSIRRAGPAPALPATDTASLGAGRERAGRRRSSGRWAQRGAPRSLPE